MCGLFSLYTCGWSWVLQLVCLSSTQVGPFMSCKVFTCPILRSKKMGWAILRVQLNFNHVSIIFVSSHLTTLQIDLKFQNEPTHPINIF